MGARGELWTTQVHLGGRSYFFNVKENRMGDVFLQVVESKQRDGVNGERHQIAIFEEDMQKFLRGFDDALDFIDKNHKEREKDTSRHSSYKFDGEQDSRGSRSRISSIEDKDSQDQEINEPTR